MGAIKVWGRVGESSPPAIVMPLRIEPSKPRLVHDQQYLNCFMRHCPFFLDQVVNLPHYLSRESYHTKLDDKSGFDHFLLSPDSLPYMGAEWGGWWLVWQTLPHGMEGKSLYLPNIGPGGNACVKKLWHSMLPVHRRSSPWRVMGVKV